MASGTTDLCEAALQCGLADPPPRASDPSAPHCPCCAQLVPRLEDQLFFSFAPVTLDFAPGDVFCVRENISSSSTSFVELRNGCLWRNIDALGPEYASLALDAVPSVDPPPDLLVPLPRLLDQGQDHTAGASSKYAGQGQSEHEGDSLSPSHSPPWPACLTRPLVKARAGCGAVRGFGSGVRSALLREALLDLAPTAPDDLLEEIVTGSVGPVIVGPKPGVGAVAGVGAGAGTGAGTKGMSARPRWFRLKGCGMPLGGGFPVVDVMDDDNQPVMMMMMPVAGAGAGAGAGAAVEGVGPLRPAVPLSKIRGAAYPHTVGIELRMSAMVHDALALAPPPTHPPTHAPCRMKGGNAPLGRWDYHLYGSGSGGGSGVGSGVGSGGGGGGQGLEFPLATRSCGIFQTRGDRRLGDHLLRGLELLLPLLISTEEGGAGAGGGGGGGGGLLRIQESSVAALAGTGLVDLGMVRDRAGLLATGDGDGVVPGVVMVADVEAWDEYDGRLPRYEGMRYDAW